MTRTVVMVEDHAPVRELYATALRGAGWRVVERPSASGLRSVVLREHARAVVMDWRLPGQDGLTALGHLKRDRATRHVRVVILTAHAASSLRQAALAAGAARVLDKPLHPADLLAALDPCYSPGDDKGAVGSLS